MKKLIALLIVLSLCFSSCAFVEDFFDGLTLQQQEGEFKYSPLVKELSGIIQLDDNYDYKADYTSYLDQKYE